jgi:hypothetical protein
MRLILQLVIACALVGAGWAIAKAQAPAPVFELQVDGPGGETTVRCLRGCALMWVERGINPNSRPMSEFSFNCTAARCSSGRVGGWVNP